MDELDGTERAVVFDFGGVLITSIHHQLADLAADRGVAMGVVKEVVMGPRESGDHPWHRAERGEIAVARIQAELGPWAESAGYELAGDEIDRVMAPGQYTVIDAMLERIDTLRAEGIRTALLTNTFAEFRPTMDRDVDLARFHTVVESFAVGARKPEPAIYEATAAALGVDHRAIVYLDDFDQNLAPAIALGWRTIHVTDPVTALADLDRALSDTP